MPRRAASPGSPGCRVLGSCAEEAGSVVSVVPGEDRKRYGSGSCRGDDECVAPVGADVKDGDCSHAYRCMQVGEARWREQVAAAGQGTDFLDEAVDLARKRAALVGFASLLWGPLDEANSAASGSGMMMPPRSRWRAASLSACPGLITVSVMMSVLSSRSRPSRTPRPRSRNSTPSSGWPAVIAIAAASDGALHTE